MKVSEKSYLWRRVKGTVCDTTRNCERYGLCYHSKQWKVWSVIPLKTVKGMVCDTTRNSEKFGLWYHSKQWKVWTVIPLKTVKGLVCATTRNSDRYGLWFHSKQWKVWSVIPLETVKGMVCDTTQNSERFGLRTCSMNLGLLQTCSTRHTATPKWEDCGIPLRLSSKPQRNLLLGCGAATGKAGGKNRTKPILCSIVAANHRAGNSWHGLLTKWWIVLSSLI